MIKQIIALIKSPKCHICKHKKLVHCLDYEDSPCRICEKCTGFRTLKDIIEGRERLEKWKENSTHIFITQEMIKLLENPLISFKLGENESTRTFKIKRYKQLGE